MWGSLALHMGTKTNEDRFFYLVVLWINAFPVRTGISQTFLPQELLVQWHLDYKKHCHVLPGTYCKVCNKPVPTNTMAWRTHEAIALEPTGNLQGSVKFYCINTGCMLKRRSFTPMTMPDQDIKRMNAIGEREEQGWEFRFINRRRKPYEWTDKVPEDDPDFQGLLNNEEDVVDCSIGALAWSVGQKVVLSFNGYWGKRSEYSLAKPEDAT
jgi:hypothetical protein